MKDMQEERPEDEKKYLEEFTQIWGHLPADIFTDMFLKEIEKLDSKNDIRPFKRKI